MTARDAIGFSLMAGIALGFEIALVSAVRAPLILTWPLALIGAWLNRRAVRKTLRIMHGAMYRLAPELCTPECWE